MKQVFLWSLVAYWFVHLGIGTGAGYAILRLWSSRHNPFLLRVTIYLHAMVIDVITTIVMVFLSKGVTLTWKFTIAWFSGSVLMDIVRVPLIVYIIRGNGKAQDAPKEGESREQ